MNPDEPTPPVGAKMPEGLSDEAQKQWSRVAPMLEQAGILTEIDADALELYCEAYARWRHANAQIAKFGVVVKSPNANFPIQSPYLAISNKAFEQMRQIIAEFGMTPSSRTRVSRAPGAGKKSRLRSVLSGAG